MSLISFGYNQQDLDSAYQRGYAEALRSILAEMDRRLPDQSYQDTSPITAHTVAASIISRLSEAQTALNEVAWLRRWEADLRADPLFAQVQRLRQELKDEQAQAAELSRDLAQAQKQLRDERATHAADVSARDVRLDELNALIARLTLQRLDPAAEIVEADKEAESENVN